MRNPIFQLSAIFAIAGSFPAVVHAQFRQPTKEEWQMTSDPKAPGADAVYLDVEENDDLQPGVSTFDARIKVLTEKGKELATVEVPYRNDCEQVALVKGRTIHSDGTVVPLAVKPENLLLVKTGHEKIERKIFSLPSVEVGSILEYHYEVQSIPCQFYRTPSWDVQKRYFVHKAHYAYSPPDRTGNLVDEHGNSVTNILSWQTLPTGASLKFSGAGHFILDVTDVPPIPNEEWSPPADSFAYQVRFFVKAADNETDFWIQEAKLWSDNLNEFTKPSNDFRAAVAGLIAPGDGDLSKAKKLYDAVQALDNTDFSRSKSESERKELKLKEVRRAEDIWAQRGGSGDQIATLYLAMLRAAGLTAYAMKVVDRDQGIFNPGYMDMDQLNDTLVILSAGGKEIYLDPGQKMCPFGTLHWKHVGAVGIRESGTGHEISGTPAPPYTANSTERTGDLSIDANGAVTGTLRFVMNGQEALRWRQTALENDADEVKKRFDGELEGMVPEGVDAHLNHFVGLNQPDSLLIAMIDVKGMLGTATSRRLLLPGFILETRGTVPFVHEESRQTSVDMHYDQLVTDDVSIHLPLGLTVEAVPQDMKTVWKSHAAYSSKVQATPGQIEVTRTLARAFTLAKPEEYQDLRGFYQKVAAADQGQLVLTAATKSGN